MQAPANAAPTPPPGNTISGSSICGATIVGGTIYGATIVGGTISGGAISGGIISQSNISAAKESPQPQPSQSPGNAQASAQAGAADAGAAAQTEPAAPAQSPRKAQSKPQARDPKRGASPRNRPGATRERPSPDDKAEGDDDDEDEADLAARALERALVQRGALLLPVWGFEIAPAFTYGHTSQDTVAAIPSASDPSTSTTVGVRKRIHQLTGSLTARLGLPFDFQIEASMPASFVMSNVTVASAASNDASGYGFGDPRVSLTWQMIHAGNVVPDIFLAANWKPRFGSSPYEVKGGDVGLGTGYDSVGGTITAVKSADPLVLLVNASYTANLGVSTDQGWHKPANAYGFGGGAILAVSPDTSLSFLLDFHYKPDDTIDGKSVIGSDETVAVLQLGLGRVLSRRVLLNVTAGIGLTADSPNFQMGISMPVRF